MRKTLVGLFAAAVMCLGMSVAASASTVYENGSLNGQLDAWTVNYGYSVSNSFSVSGSTTLTDATVGLWIYPGDVPTSVSWAIGDEPDGAEISSGTASSLTNTLEYTNDYGYYVYDTTFAISGSLSAGNYWFSITNASDNFGEPVYWDINMGPSSAWESYYGYIDPSTCEGVTGESGTCSDYFSLSGGTSGTPEPASLLLMGSGLLMFGGYVRRRLGK